MPIGAPKNHPKWGGRKAGTPNKRTVIALDLQHELEKHNVDIVSKILECIESENFEAAGIYTKLLPFLIPKKSEVKVEAEVTAVSVQANEDRSALLELLRNPEALKLVESSDSEPLIAPLEKEDTRG